MQPDREELLTLLKRVEPAAAGPGANTQGNSIVLRHIWFTGTHVCAYNGSLGIRTRCNTEFSCGVLGSTMIGLLGSIADDRVGISHNAKSGGLDIDAKRVHANLPALPAEQNPWPFGRQKSVLELKLSEGLLAALKEAQLIKVKVADSSRIEHQGVTLFIDKSGTKLFTTDSRALVQIGIKEALPKELNGVVLPHPFVEQLAALDMIEARIGYAENSVLATLPTIQVGANLMDNAGVQDLPAIVEKHTAGNPHYTAWPDLEGSLARAAVLAGGTEQAIAQATMRVHASGGELLLDGEFEFGELHDVLPQPGKRAGSGKITVRLAHLKALNSKARKFHIIDNAVLVLLGDAGSVFLIASKSS